MSQTGCGAAAPMGWSPTPWRNGKTGGLLGQADEAILKAAVAHKLTLVTYDCRTIPPLLKACAEADLHHGGVILVDAKTIPPSDIGGLVRTLAKLGRETAGWPWSDQVIFLRR